MPDLQEALRVLIIEDEDGHRLELETALAKSNLNIVFESAPDYDSALSQLFSTYYDVVILDLLLHIGPTRSVEPDDNLEGLWILQELLEAGLQGRIPVIISSGIAKDRAPLVGQAFRRFGVLDVWYKSQIDMYTAEFMEVLETEHYFGLACRVSFESSLNWTLLVKALGDRFRWASAAIDFEAAELELRHVLRKLFAGSAEIRVAPLGSGMGGAAVILVTPILSGDAECARVVVKYGAADIVVSEQEKFNTIKHFMQGTRTTQIEGIAAGRHLGAISYSFVGSSDGAIQPFTQYYSLSGSGDIKTCLTDLFTDTCKLWYLKPNRSALPEASVEEAYSGYLGITRANVQTAFEFRYRERPFAQQITIPAIARAFDHPIDEFVNGKFLIPTRTIACRTHGDLHPNNIFVDQRTRVSWLIDFGRTGIGHWARDFVCLEASLVIRHTPSHPIPRVFEFLDAWLRLSRLDEPIRFNDAAYPEMVKAGDCVSHLRSLASGTMADSGLGINELLLDYCTALFFQLLNYTRLHKLIRDTNRKNYVLIALCLLSERIKALRTILGLG
ncbi:MAG TPA: phosphotransferase [Bryobacteraceae bacterium]|nr:phosphotransferase [Bryobacteraceae bacterium]